MRTEEEIKKRLGEAKEVLIDLEGCYDFISEMARIEIEEAVRTLEWVLESEEI